MFIFFIILKYSIGFVFVLIFVFPFQAVSSNGEVGVVMDDDIAGFDGEPFPSGSVTENWSDQLTMKVKVK